MDENALQTRLRSYHFYHVIQLTDTTKTPGWDRPDILQIQETTLRALRTLNVRDKRVLDIGCRDGLFSFEAEKLGAREIIGIDNDLSLGATDLLIPYFRSKVKMHELNLYDLKPDTFGLFDVVIFPGVLYHLRYPFWGLKLIRDVLRDDGTLVLETATLVDENQHAMLYCPVGAESPYEPTSCTFYNLKGLTDTLASLDILVKSFECFENHHLRMRKPWPQMKQRLRSLLGLPRRILLDRATLICEKSSARSNEREARVGNYWHGKHKTHSQAEYAW